MAIIRKLRSFETCDYIFISGYINICIMGFPVGSVIKNLPANAGDTQDVVSIPRLGISPGGKKWQPTTIFFPGKIPCREESGGVTCHYSPWCHKESDMAEHTRIGASCLANAITENLE